jgi:transcriptional regulator with XRE-family HTH domain
VDPTSTYRPFRDNFARRFLRFLHRVDATVALRADAGDRDDASSLLLSERICSRTMSIGAAKTVRGWRARERCSQAELGRRAGVPASTIRRIETGEVDPTLTMLQRIAGAAGRHIRIDDAPIERTTPSLAMLAAIHRDSTTIDWTALRALLDLLHRRPKLIEPAIATPPARTDDRRFDSLLAAIAEKLADDDSGVERPRWTASVPRLDEPWEASGTRMMRQRSRAATPPQFATRNIWLAANNLWRDRAWTSPRS